MIVVVYAELPVMLQMQCFIRGCTQHIPESQQGHFHFFMGRKALGSHKISCVREVQKLFETIPQSKAGLHNTDTDIVVVHHKTSSPYVSKYSGAKVWPFAVCCLANVKVSKRAGSVNNQKIT